MFINIPFHILLQYIAQNMFGVDNYHLSVLVNRDKNRCCVQVKCLACEHVSERKETFRDVLLQVAGQQDLVSV